MQIVKSFFLVIVLASFLISCNNSPQAKKGNSIAEKSQKTQETTINLELFFQAALEGNINVVEEAINKGININSADTENRTALMLSAFNGHLEIVKLLITKGSDVNILDATNRTALMFASTGPFNSTVELLLDAGSNPNIADNVEQWTAVMFAAAEGQLEVVKTLVANGADLSMLDQDGESAYDFALLKGHTEVAEYIKSRS